MKWPESHYKHCLAHKDSNGILAIADEVDRLFGYGITSVMLSTVGATDSLYIDSRFPTWQKAFEYARELYDAAQTSREKYERTLRK